MLLIYKVRGNCKTFFCSFEGNEATKLSRHENLTFDKPAVQNKSQISCCQHPFTSMTKTIHTHTHTHTYICQTAVSFIMIILLRWKWYF